jgi:mannose-6-phosphate isomerase-like protein (cupin superfamily)
MYLRNAISSCMICTAIAGVSLFPANALAGDIEKPSAKVLKLDSGGKKDLQLLSGPPETVTMRSGLVTLEPQQSVGKHSTRQHEEMLVVLKGEGKMLFGDGSSLPVDTNHVLYCPPETEHDVVNTGPGVLRYVYIVASTK